MSSTMPRLRLLVVADFALGEAGPVTLETTDLDAVLGRLTPHLTVRIPDRLAGRRGQTLECSLTWSELASFEPAQIVASVPALDELRRARQQVAEALESGALDLEAVRMAMPHRLRDSDLGARLSPAVATGGDRLGDFLSQVVVPGEEPSRVLADLRDEIDLRLTRQLEAVRADPRLRAVEESWRGLAFLLSQGAAESLSIELLSATRDDFLETFFDRAFHREYEGEEALPLAAVVLGFTFDRSLADLERLGHVARMGESLRVPFLASMGPGYFGLKRLALLPRMPDLPGKSRGAEYAKWNSLRDAERSQWLTLSQNRLLLRDAWGSTETSLGAGFEWRPETAGAEAEPLWGVAAWALAAALGRALTQGGLSLPMTAVELTALRCRPYGGRRGEPFPYPLEVRLSEDKALELAECGLAVLSAEPGEGSARFPYLPTYHRARVYTTPEATRKSYQAATLPYQLFAALASRQLENVTGEISPSMSGEEVEGCFTRRFGEFLGKSADGTLPEDASVSGEGGEPTVSVESSDDPMNPRVRELTVRLKPDFEVCGGAVDLVLGIQVPY